jgi:hypothetical protein
MSITKRFYILALSFVPVLLIGGIFVAQAAWTWVNPTATPPNNGDIQILKADGNDGLGNHIATQDVNLTDATGIAHRIYNVGASGAADQALVATSTGNAIGGLVKADDGYGAYIKSSSNLGQPAVFARNVLNSSSAYALIASSTKGWAAQFGQSLQLATTTGQKAQLQWNAGSPDILSSASNPTPAAKSLYWGTKLLCDATKANCGRVTSSAGDNLGDHQGRFDLDMQSFSLMNVENKIGATLATSSLQLNHSGTGADSGPGLYASGDSTHGIVASNTIPTSAVAAWGHNFGAGYGVVGSSVAGPGMSLYGRVTLLTETANATPPQLTFGPETEKNSLALQAAADPATQNLYWGDSLLCDATQNNCGWSAVAGSGASYWDLVSGNLFTNYLTSIGGIGTSAKLELVQSSNSTISVQNFSLGVQGGSGGEQFSSGSRMTDLEDDTLYVLTRHGINVYSLVIPQTPVLSYSINLASYTFDMDTSSMDVVGDYAYIAYGEASVSELIIVKLSTKAIISTTDLGTNWNTIRVLVKGDYAYIGGGHLTTAKISDPVNVLITSSTVGVNTNIYGMDIQGNYLYYIGLSGGGIIDLRNPASPTSVYEFNTASVCGSIATSDIIVRGSIAYVACSLSGVTATSASIKTLDVSIPQTPNLIGSVNIGEFLSGTKLTSVSLVGNFLYITHGTNSFGSPNGVYDELSIVNVSNPATMSLVYSQDWGNFGLYSIKLYGQYGYAYNNDGSGSGNDDVLVFGPLSSVASFQDLHLGYEKSDAVIVDGNLTGDANMYIRGGLVAGSNLTVSSGVLNSSIGTIYIGGLKLDSALLQKLINWSS